MGSVKINEIVQDKLRDFKEESGSKTFSDAINLLLSEHSKLLHRDFVKLANECTDLSLIVSKLKKERKEIVNDLTALSPHCDVEKLSRVLKKWKGKK